MNERLAKAEAVFHDALELPADQRETFLQNACGDDAELRHEVVALLRASGVADRWLRETERVEAPPSEVLGTMIGRYKLLEALGEGGCGAVWLAEQREPVRRKVALKIIKLGMDSRQVVARFEAERQALALMDHPNIAKVFDAGTTDTGRPYFVMELVRGIPITKFCDENKLATGERLDLFIKVCQAVQHAHQKGIIHRDLKPSNILITLHDGVPVPKVPGEGPHAPLRNGERPGNGLEAPSQQRAGRRASAQRGLSLPETRSTAAIAMSLWLDIQPPRARRTCRL